MIRAALFCAARGIPWTGPSGASAHLRGIARALSERCELVVAVATRTDERGIHDADERTVLHLPPRGTARGFRSVRAWRDGAALARLVGPVDLLWERHAPPADGTRVAASRRLLELNAPGRERWGRDRWPWTALERRAVRQADRVVAVSPWLADWATALGARDVRLVPNGSDVGELPDRDGARTALGVTGPVFATVGSGGPWQGRDRLPELLEALPGWTGLCVGPGPVPAHPRLRALGPLWGAARDAVYAAADVLVAPYTDLAPPWVSPLKRVDAAAAGRPLVIGRVGDVVEARPGEVVLDPSASAAAWAEAATVLLGTARERRMRPWAIAVEEACGDGFYPDAQLTRSLPAALLR